MKSLQIYHYTLPMPTSSKPLHSPCIYAAFRVKEHPSPALRWFTTPSPNGQGMFETKKPVKLRISKFLTF